MQEFCCLYLIAMAAAGAGAIRGSGGCRVRVLIFGVADACPGASPSRPGLGSARPSGGRAGLPPAAEAAETRAGDESHWTLTRTVPVLNKLMNA